MTLTRRLAVGVVALALVTGAGACSDPPKPVKPSLVPDGLVPPSVQNNEFNFYESTNPGVQDAFANAGKNSLAADGRLYELRKGDRLVGALQISTLLPDVKLHNKNHRDQILKRVMPSIRDQFMVDEVNVWTTATPDKTQYLWFGKDLFALMTLKGGTADNLDPELILGEVVTFNVSNDKWKPLYIDDEETSDI